MRIWSPAVRRAAAIATIAVTVAACGSASTRSSGTTSTSAAATPVVLGAPVPHGTTLRVGDQLDYLKTVLKLAHEDTGFPYDVEYAAFIGGPPMLQAFQGGAIDTGFIGTTPLIFAQAQGQQLRAIAGWANERGSYSLVTAPGVTDVHGWKDLAGKKVAYQRGTAGEAALRQALDRAGVDPGDVTPVDVPQTQVSAALSGGSADAGISVEPLTSVYLAANSTARQVAATTALTDRSSFLIATDDALHDRGTSAALGDYLARLVRAFSYLRAHPDLVAQAVFVQQYGLPEARAKELVAANGVAKFFPLPGAIASPQQRLADLFADAGQIPAKIDVAGEFDTRFNDLVAQAQHA